MEIDHFFRVGRGYELFIHPFFFSHSGRGGGAVRRGVPDRARRRRLAHLPHRADRRRADRHALPPPPGGREAAAAGRPGRAARAEAAEQLQREQQHQQRGRHRRRHRW